MLETAGASGALRFHTADLTSDDGWSAAVAGAEYVLHVASPFPADQSADAAAMVEAARGGTLRVLRAARGAGVRRVVVTSSFAAVGYGHGGGDRVLDEQDWTDLDGDDVTGYVASKTLAERAAWEFAREAPDLELTVVNPVGIFGPVLGPDHSSSTGIIRRMLDGGMPVAPPVWTNTVDVRDAADLHVRAMTAPAAAGQRYLALAGEPISFAEVGAVLRHRLGDAGRLAPVQQIPAATVRQLAGTQPDLAGLVPQLDVVRRASNHKARTELGWSPRSNEDAVAATGESLLRLGLLGGRRR